MSDEGDFWIGLLTGAGICYAGLVWGLEYEAPRQEPRQVVAQIPPPAKPEPERPEGILDLGSSETGAIWLARAAEVRGPREKRTIWVKADFSADKTVAFRGTDVLYEIDCETTGYRVLSERVTMPDGSDTKTDYDREKTAVTYAVPSTMGGAVVEAACVPEFDIPPN